METPTENWREKNPKNLLQGKHDKGDEINSSEDEKLLEASKDLKKNIIQLCFQKNRLKSKTKSSESRSTKKSSKRDPSLQHLAASLNDNCCQFIGAFARYIREVFSCVFCVAMCAVPNMEFEEMFGELLDAGGCVCRDLVLFIRKFLQVCVGTSSK